jgi:hypothetical protein
MDSEYSVGGLLEFLEHAAERGLMPVATSRALSSATRNVLGVLSEDEASDVRQLDLDSVIRRFTNKRARDFTPDSLKEYDRRTRKAVALFKSWREDPANFRAPTRTTTQSKKPKTRPENDARSGGVDPSSNVPTLQTMTGSGYQTAFPLRAGHVVTLTNIPEDLSTAEAERLGQFIKMLATSS